MNMLRGVAFGALLLAGCGVAAAAEIAAGLSGAWATSEADCKKLFVHAGGGFTFRRPVDEFAQAAIITPGKVVLPSQTCQVKNVSHDGALTKLSFECRDSISYTSQSVDIEVKSASEIVYRPNGDKTLDTTLVRCR